MVNDPVATSRSPKPTSLEILSRQWLWLQVVVVVILGVACAMIPVEQRRLITKLLAAILGSVGIAGAGMAIVLGVDRLIDMCRTGVNVMGDLVACVVIDQSECDCAETPDAA